MVHKTYHEVTEDICHTIEAKPSRLWYIGFFISVAFLMFGVYSVYREVVYGIGQWNVNRTIDWGWDITNFVWWVGIGHAGTLISAILLLFRQGWRTGVNRAAEAMTIFAVMCAGQFPIFHMGRVWMAFFTLPYPNTRGPLWPNFNSPLMWDVFAISTYFTVSLLFWYSGLIPDLATVRDRAKTKFRKHFYGIAIIRLDRQYQTLAASRKSFTGTGRFVNTHWYCRCTPSYPSTSPLQSFRDGIPPSSLLTSLRVPSSPVLPWCKH